MSILIDVIVDTVVVAAVSHVSRPKQPKQNVSPSPQNVSVDEFCPMCLTPRGKERGEKEEKKKKEGREKKEIIIIY